MVSVQPSSISPLAVDVVITFKSESSPIYIAADIMDWQPQLMATNGEAYEHVITVPRNQRTLLYKFRIGDHHWIHDTSVSAEPDNLGGFNNRFDIPDISYPESNVAPSECSEVTELESVAAVESVADTVSEMSYDGGRVSHDEAEFIDVDDSKNKKIESSVEESASTPKINVIHFDDDAVQEKHSSNVIYGYAALGLVLAAIALLWRTK